MGIKGCVGAMDCRKREWKDGPDAHRKKYYNSKEGHLVTIKVEAWRDHTLFVWN